MCTDPAVAELLRREDDGSTLFSRDPTESEGGKKKTERGTNEQEGN